uniref:Uncharacterized protein n=1 Tax=Arundo donax TaxID=35708 RepID=A0A0A9E885_ARUDO
MLSSLVVAPLLEVPTIILTSVLEKVLPG